MSSPLDKRTLTPEEAAVFSVEYDAYLLSGAANEVADNLRRLSNEDYDKLRAAVYAHEAEMLNEDSLAERERNEADDYEGRMDAMHKPEVF